MSLNTTGIRTDAGCWSAPNVTLDTSNPTSFSISASLADGCSSSVTFNSSSAEQQYGTAPTDPVSCGLPAGTGEEFAPVMFWFFHTNAAGTPQAKSVICRPTLDLFNIWADVNLNNQSLIDVVITNNYTKPNNITGAPLNGKVYNA